MIPRSPRIYLSDEDLKKQQFNQEIKEIIMNENRQIDLETPAISALATASKTPFWTAFKVTLGIGLARLLMFVGVLLTLTLAFTLIYKLLN